MSKSHFKNEEEPFDVAIDSGSACYQLRPLVALIGRAGAFICSTRKGSPDWSAPSRIPTSRSQLSLQRQRGARLLLFACHGSPQAGPTNRGSPIPVVETCTSNP